LIATQQQCCKHCNKKIRLIFQQVDGAILSTCHAIKQVGRVQDAGWIKRCDAAHDKLQSLVSLMAAGRRKVQPLLKQAKAHEAQVVSALGTDPAHQLRLMLESLIAAHGST
jgi:hypothetical protein